MKAVVMMSSYNGSQFIEQQLDSIFSQIGKIDIKLVIRDDNSTDDTVAMIENYKKNHSVDLDLISGENLGVQKSFLELIQIVPDGDYYFFSDQDDIWHSDKILEAVDSMESQNEKYVFYCANYSLGDQELSIFDKYGIKEKPDFTPLGSLFFNKVPGCTMAFNYNFLMILRKIKIQDVMMHDSYALMVAASLQDSAILYENNPAIIHRIHDSNVIGHGSKKINVFRWIKEKTSLLRNGETYDVALLGERILNVCGEKIRADQIENIRLLAHYKNNLSQTVRLIRHSDLKTGLSRCSLSIKCKILFHIF